MKKNTSFYIFIASVGLILVAVILTSIIDRVKSNRTPDIRARASKTTGSMVFTGQTGDYLSDKNILVVNNMKFADSGDKSLGTWQITPPNDFRSSQFPAGSNVKITGNPVTFLIVAKTMTALEIVKQ
jgi:hypothetical protein